MKVNAVQEILNKNVANLGVLCATLDNENIGSYHARSTKLSRVRTSIAEQLPVFINFGNDVYAVVGEDENELVLLDRSGLYASVPDSLLEKNWNGEAVFVTGEQQPVTPPNTRFVVYDSVKSNWDAKDNEKLFKVIEILNNLDSLDKKYLPQSSVILCARKPDKEERKDHQVAHSIGVTITVLLSDNLLEAVLHEIGHVYWNSLLTDYEKFDWNEIVKSIDLEKQHTVPKIVKNPYEVSSGEEFFCTAYAWYLTGLIFNEGYLKILGETFKEGKKLLDKTFNRVGNSLDKNSKYKKQEALLKQYLKTLRKEPIVVNANHTKLFKAQVTLKNVEALEEEVEIFPSDLPVGLLKSSLRHSHFVVLDGKLKDFILITNNQTGKLDWEYMKENPSQLKVLHKAEFDINDFKVMNYADNVLTLCKAKGRKLPEPMKLIQTSSGNKIVYNTWKKRYEGAEIKTQIPEKKKDEIMNKAWSFLNWFTK